MDTLRSTALPALLVLLLASVGWLLDKSIDRLSSIYFIQYETAIYPDTTPPRFRLVVQNSSLSGTIDDLVVAVACPNGSDCFLPVNANAAVLSFFSTTLYEVAPKAVKNVNDEASAIQISLSLIAGSRMTFDIRLADKTTVPGITFRPKADQEKSFSIVRGRSFTALIAKHYTTILLAMLVSILGLVILYLLVLIFSRGKPKGTKDEVDSSRFDVVLRFDGRGSHERGS
ncbi:hypothetical protein [Kaistia terrae]|uniref:Uncharacterized protein n=1 Tax=Kaistia terrae TaxID=537017 RepID=A0ABW0Q171_9HYPH|nr:hypothetical protein [Kaistia terrae]MCX5579555.1 hypothetical protein [Kaistia terrae]